MGKPEFQSTYPS